VGNQKGWRLPSLFELMSLVDPAGAAPPTLPPGHPFTDVQAFGGGSDYWSATTVADFPTADAWIVNFTNGAVGHGTKSSANHVWCVRGPMNADKY
jgi:hypothetical protein